MLRHTDINDKELLASIRKRLILVGGNRILKIYGTLHCSSGKRMKRQSRIFFKSEIEAKRLGYRPCGICMPKAYKIWKNEATSNK
ncbi:MAG: Ada metal-binding domain-containing protein [Saprospiraceae bacterium]